MHTIRNLVRRWAALAVVLTAASQVHADPIDDELVKQAPALFSYLQKEGLHNVGVLRFQVRKGKEPATFAAGSMNTNMVTRLENLLLIGSDAKTPVQLLRDPGYVIAAKKAKLSYLDSTARKTILGLPYTYIGSTKKVNADGFLTGMVHLTPDYLKTTVTISSFSTKQPGLQTVMEFTVGTDRNILSDIGESFIISKRSLKKGEDLNHLAAKSAMTRAGLKKNSEDPFANKDPGPGPKQPINLGDVLQFQVLYDGEVQTISADASGKKEQIPEPRESQNVLMKIKNIADRRIGVILSVNGVSTIFQQEGELTSMRKWVLDPKEEYAIKGYYLRDKTPLPFKVIPDETTDEPMSPDKAGQIQVAIFDEEPEKEKKISLRGITDFDLRKVRPKSQNELKTMVQERSNLKKNERGFIVPGDTPLEIRSDLKEVEFSDGTLLGTRTIVYFRPGTTKKESEKSKEK
jgi:hypothetical protein